MSPPPLANMTNESLYQWLRPSVEDRRFPKPACSLPGICGVLHGPQAPKFTVPSASRDVSQHSCKASALNLSKSPPQFCTRAGWSYETGSFTDPEPITSCFVSQQVLQGQLSKGPGTDKGMLRPSLGDQPRSLARDIQKGLSGRLQG